MGFTKRVLFIPSIEGTEIIHVFSPPQVYNPTKVTAVFLVEPDIDVGISVMSTLKALNVRDAVPIILIHEVGVPLGDVQANLKKKDSLLYLLDKHFEDRQDVSFATKIRELTIEPREEKIFVPTILKKDRTHFTRMVFQNEKKFTVNKNGFPNKFFRSGGQFRRL